MPLLTVTDMQNRVSELVYDGWELSVREGFAEGPHFIATATVEDTTKPGEMVYLEVHSPIHPQLSVESFDLWLFGRLKRLAVHEFMEKFKVRATGEPLFNPHISDKDDYEVYRQAII